MAWDFFMHFGDFLEIISLRIDKTGTESGVALACSVLSPFSKLPTSRAESSGKGLNPQQGLLSCFESTIGITFVNFNLLV